MITVEQAKKLQYGQTLYHVTLKGYDGLPLRVRVASRVKTWKRDPNRVQVSVKYGLYHWYRLDEHDLDSWCLTEEEAKQCTE